MLEITLYRKYLGLSGNPYIQPCRGMHVDADILIEDSSLQVAGLLSRNSMTWRIYKSPNVCLLSNTHCQTPWNSQNIPREGTEFHPVSWTQRDFNELLDDDKIAFSNEHWHAMLIVNWTIKHVDEYKFQITVPLRHLTLNLPDNIIQAKNRLNQQRKSDLILWKN